MIWNDGDDWFWLFGWWALRFLSAFPLTLALSHEGRGDDRWFGRRFFELGWA